MLGEGKGDNSENVAFGRFPKDVLSCMSVGLPGSGCLRPPDAIRHRKPFCGDMASSAPPPTHAKMWGTTCPISLDVCWAGRSFIILLPSSNHSGSTPQAVGQFSSSLCRAIPLPRPTGLALACPRHRPSDPLSVRGGPTCSQTLFAVDRYARQVTCWCTTFHNGFESVYGAEDPSRPATALVGC
jgi:hypothetical protein